MANEFHNRGFLYGDGFFETMRIIDQDIPLWDLHLARAKQSAEYLECEWFSFKQESVLKNYILNNQPGGKDIARVDFFRSGGGTYTPESNTLETSCTYRGIPQRPSAFKFNSLDEVVKTLSPIDVKIYREAIKPITPLSWIKSSSALFYVKAGLYLKQHEQVSDLILLNDQGRVCEALSSNVLIKRHGQWIGVSRAEGPVQGVFQRHLQRNLDIQFGTIEMDELYDADKIVLTNAATGVTVANLSS